MPDKLEITIELENVHVVEFFMKPDWKPYRYYKVTACVPPQTQTQIEIHPDNPWFDRVDASAVKAGIVTALCKYVR